MNLPLLTNGMVSLNCKTCVQSYFIYLTIKYALKNCLSLCGLLVHHHLFSRERRGRGRIVAEFTTTSVISAYHH
jgi:hypothetical protein